MQAHDEDGAAAPTQDAVEVSAVLPHRVEHVWKVLTTNDGVQAFLGTGATLGGKGDSWHAADGTHGVWRSYHPMEQVRLSWHADEGAPRSLVDLHLRPQGEHTHVSLRHEHASGDLAALEQRWSAALGRIDAATG